MELIDQIKLHKALSKQIEELEEQKKALGLSILQQMNDKTLQVPGYMVRRCSRISIKLSIEKARELNATKMEESVDKEKIKALYQEGEAIEGVSELHYTQTTSRFGNLARRLPEFEPGLPLPKQHKFSNLCDAGRVKVSGSR